MLGASAEATPALIVSGISASPCLDRAPQALGELERGGAVGAGQDDHELLAADAGDDVGAAGVAAEHRGQPDQRAVAGLVAVLRR